LKISLITVDPCRERPSILNESDTFLEDSTQLLYDQIEPTLEQAAGRANGHLSDAISREQPYLH